jgi:hypothetical protein
LLGAALKSSNLKRLEVVENHLGNKGAVFILKNAQKLERLDLGKN